MRRRGFTLLELLVVLGILSILAGLSLSAFFTIKKQNPLIAAESLVADLLRQARHSARSSNAPVQLIIKAGDSSIQGVSQVPLYSNLCEDFLGIGSGRSGTAAWLKGIPGGADPDNDLEPAERMQLPLNLPLRQCLGSAPQDSFYLSLAVRPPMVTDGASTIPLAMVAAAASGGNSVAVQDSVCGFALVPDSRTVQNSRNGAGAVGMRSWDIVGWLRSGGSIEEISLSTDQSGGEERKLQTAGKRAGDTAPDGIAPLLLAIDDQAGDLAMPLAGGRWEEIGLLWNGPEGRLCLYRNGRRVAERQISGASLEQPGAEQVLVLGQAVMPGGSGPTYAHDTLVDDLRLLRLGVDTAGRLPKGIVPDKDYRIVCHPDGRVEINGGQGIGTSTLTLLGGAGEGDTRRAVITITSDGSVSSEISSL